MDVDFILSADEIATAANYEGIFTAIDASLDIVSYNSKNWFTRSSDGTDVNKIPAASSARKYAGIRFVFPTTITHNQILMQLLTPGGAGEILRVRSQSDGSLLIGKGTEFNTAAGLIQVGTEHFFEVDCPVVSGLSSTVIGYLDGVEVYNESVPTGSFGDSAIGAFGLWTSDDHLVRDVYCSDAGILGVGRCESLHPNGAGAANEWDHGGGGAGDATNYAEVDDLDPDEDATYVTASDVGVKDSYALTNLVAGTGQIAAVVEFMRARKDDANARILHTLLRSGGGTEAEGADHAMTTSYGWYWDSFGVEPGGAAWTRAKVDALQPGQIVDT